MAQPTDDRAPRRPSLPLDRYFCLTGSGTAALLSDRGSCDFLCSPRFDSRFALAAVLDPSGGGSVGVEPKPAGPSVAAWGQGSRELVLDWPSGITARCALVPDAAGHPSLVWLVEGPPGLPVRVAAADPTAGGGGRWRPSAYGLSLPAGGSPDGPGGPLELVVSAPSRADPQGLRTVLSPGGLLVWLGSPDQAGGLPRGLEQGAGPAQVTATRAQLDRLRSGDRDWVGGLLEGPQLEGIRERAPAFASQALGRSLLTLAGLQDPDSGLVVASPLTSIPQWPGGERSWDYRYAWLRDCADCGLALARAGAFAEASKLGLGLARRLEVDPAEVAPVRRLDGGGLPLEHRLEHLSGYGGATVRVGNAAAGQAQIDTIGEVVRFAEELDRLGGCPQELLDQIPRLAELARAGWRLPDHGIWEVRGARRHYVHSKLLAWAALDAAVRLAAVGRIPATDAAAWEQARSAVRQAISSCGTGPGGRLTMAFDDGAADASTLAAYLVGYLGGGQGDAATLDYVLSELEDRFLLARYKPERDRIPGPCAPFIFPSVWAAMAEAKLGRAAAAVARLEAIVGLAGPAGQISEVADPASRTMLGNYPQVQSHAALVEAVVQLWGPAPAGRANLY